MKGTKILPLLSKWFDGCENLHITRLVIPSSQNKQLLNSTSRLLTMPLKAEKGKKSKREGQLPNPQQSGESVHLDICFLGVWGSYVLCP